MHPFGPNVFKLDTTLSFLPELNISKMTADLCQSSRVFVPVDDPIPEVFNKAAEVI